MSEDTILYHYCSNKVLASIAKSKQLWMCDIANSSDYSEVRMLIPGLFYAVEELYKDSSFPFKYRDLCDLDGVKRMLRETSEYINNTYANGSLTSFVACFCEKGDVLGQWRGYSNDGKGCSLGFALEELKKYCESSYGVIRLEKVEYVDKNELDKIIREKANDFLRKVKSAREESEEFLKKNYSTPEMFEDFLFFLFAEYFKAIIYDSLKYKWKSFCEELEWRMFFCSITKDAKMLFDKNDKQVESFRKGDKTTRLLESKIDFEVRDDNIIAYYPVELLELSDNPIKEIWIGPKNKSKKQDMQLLFARHGISEIDIKYSEITYC